MKCLDTDLLVAILRGQESAQEAVAALDEEGGASTTAVNAYEILFGAWRSARREENLQEARRLLAKLTVLPLDPASAEKAAEMHATLLDKGAALDVRDVFIAAVVLCTGSRIVTRNVKDFSRIRELRVESW